MHEFIGRFSSESRELHWCLGNKNAIVYLLTRHLLSLRLSQAGPHAFVFLSSLRRCADFVAARKPP